MNYTSAVGQTMAKLSIKQISKDTSVAVFGMSDTQWTVSGGPVVEYYNGRPDTDEISVKLEPPCARILVRARNMELRWRPDRRFHNPERDTYEGEWVKDFADDLELDLGEYLERDPIMRERRAKPPAVNLVDSTAYEPFSLVPEAEAALPPTHVRANGLSDEKKHIYVTIPDSVRKEVEHFRHSLPREIMWLLYVPLPLSNNRSELSFFYYEFGPPHDIDAEVLEEEPWRLDAKNQIKLTNARERFVAKVAEWGGEFRYLSSRELKNISPRHLQEDHPLTLPEIIAVGVDKLLWRYLDFPKFVSLIETQSLWFARPSSFDDPFESKTNKATRLKHLLRWMNRLVDDYNSAIHDGDEEYIMANSWWASELVGAGQTISPLEYASIFDVPARFRFYSERSLDAALDAMLINCWHQNEHESDAMWRACTDSRYGVAVTTSFESLRTCFRSERANPKVLSVTYHDLHDDGVVFDHLPSAYKHLAFAHELEVRAYFPSGDLSVNAPGMLVPVDLTTLIERVTVSPNAPSWFKRSVIWVLNRAGLEVNVYSSVFSKKLY